MAHRYVAGSDRQRPPLLLLNRTGGTENDLIEVGHRVAPGASLLGLRGNVEENGQSRFFRRVGAGSFDLDDLKVRVQEFVTFLEWARHTYALSKPIGFGFSNGANILWPMMLTHTDTLAGAVLMRPMRAFNPVVTGVLDNVPVLVLAGRADKTVPPNRAQEIPELLRSAGADVTLEWADAAHDFSADDERIATQWLNKFA